MILCKGNPKATTRKLLEFINDFGKVAGQQIDTQKSVAFLHTNNKTLEREFKETSPLIIKSKRVKYVGIKRQKTYILETVRC